MIKYISLINSNGLTVNEDILMKRGKFNNWIIKTSHCLDQLRRKDSGSVIDLLTNISI